MMGYVDLIEPHIAAMVNEAPPALRNEIAEAVAWWYGWEEWRLRQDPVPNDNFANRAAFAKRRMAEVFRNEISQRLGEYRRRGDDESAELDT